MGFRNMHSTQFGLVLNLLTGSISPHYHVVFDDMLSTVVSSTAADTEVLISKCHKKLLKDPGHIIPRRQYIVG